MQKIHKVKNLIISLGKKSQRISDKNVNQNTSWNYSAVLHHRRGIWIDIALYGSSWPVT